ncbi:MAG: GNAT family N-acetyltransferase [Clostridia bacterium]|nr:GNAT family N-acetyltransferase [Clostridia bacterium]
MLSYKLVSFDKDKDLEYIYNLKKMCYEIYVEHFYGGWDEQKQREMFDDYLKENEKNIYLIYIEDLRIGFIDGKELSNTVYEQGNICISPKFRGKGIGTIILKDIIKKHKDKEIYLRVFKNNPAQNLYKRLGFEIIGETHSHYKMVKK